MQAARKAVLGLATLAALGLAAALPQAAHAQTTPAVYSGMFTADDQHLPFTFDVTTAGVVSLYTTSYAGGLNVDGTTAAAGGFDPILSLFNDGGSFDLIGFNDDNSPNADPVTGNTWDAGLQETLQPGHYLVIITEWDNFANGPTLLDGFTRQGQGNFTQGFVPAGGTAQAPFVDDDGNQRTGAYTINIANGPLPGAPEPSSVAGLGLGILGMAGLLLTARRRKALAA